MKIQFIGTRRKEYQDSQRSSRLRNDQIKQPVEALILKLPDIDMFTDSFEILKIDIFRFTLTRRIIQLDWKQNFKN